MGINSSHKLRAPECGKSSVFKRYVQNCFDPDYTPTKVPVIDNVVKTVKIPGNCIVSLNLWDLPGREDLDLRHSYYRDLDAAVVVVDVSDSSTIELAGVWKQEVVNKVTVTKCISSGKPGVIAYDDEVIPMSANIPVLLLGTKYDKIEKTVVQNQSTEQEKLDGVLNGNRIKRPLTYLETPECVRLLYAIGQDHGFIASVAVSAKENDESVHSAITCLVRHLIQSKHPHLIDTWRSIDSMNTQSNLPSVLARVNIPEIDEVFSSCDELMRFCAKLRRCHHFSVMKLRELCFDYGFIESATANIAECILGLRQATPTGYELQSIDDEGFCVLTLKICDPVGKPPTKMKKVIKCFNTKYASISKSALRHADKLDEAFTTYSARLSEFCNRTITGGADLAKFCSTILYNRDIIQRCHDDFDGCINEIRDVLTSILSVVEPRSNSTLS